MEGHRPASWLHSFRIQSSVPVCHFHFAAFEKKRKLHTVDTLVSPFELLFRVSNISFVSHLEIAKMKIFLSDTHLVRWYTCAEITSMASTYKSHTCNSHCSFTS